MKKQAIVYLSRALLVFMTAHRKKVPLYASIGVWCILVVTAPSYAEYTTRNEVRQGIETDNWQVVWGITINEGEYAKFIGAIAAAIATENPAPIYAYFDDYLNRTIDKVVRNAPEIGLRALHNLIMRAFDSRGQIFRNGRLEVSAGIATYRRWERVVYDEPRTYKCKQNLPLGGWTWSVCTTTERVEKEIPWPNHHQPYVRFRWASSTTSQGDTRPSQQPVAPSATGVRFIHAPNGDWGRAHSDSIINYIAWDGQRWTARINGNAFLHAPNGDWGRAHSDSIINYIAWDNQRWTARIQ
jgi:hypothetical protein